MCIRDSRHGMLVLADEAHGTHFYFHDELPVSAMAAGADMAAVSMHTVSYTHLDVYKRQVFPQFADYMSRYTKKNVRRGPLFSNAAGTGQYVWEKDTLIDLTFSQVLDRMVEEFPDQYAFRFTVLDYKRTYAEFREDVDRFARALIAMGVKRGDHVAIWATNVPQWYITFWATTKIGAVLVTVNTAYKIHEAEYLLRQSDTHTLVMIDGYKDSDLSLIHI